MIKHPSVPFSAASVAKGVVVLSKASGKNFALQSKNSRLWRHIWVLSKMLHSVALERNYFESLPLEIRAREVTGGFREPSGDVVAEELGVAEKPSLRGGISGAILLYPREEDNSRRCPENQPILRLPLSRSGPAWCAST